MRNSATLLVALLLTVITLSTASACNELPGDRSGAETIDQAVDLSDRRKLVGFADHVYVGRVQGLKGRWNDMPAGKRRASNAGWPLDTVRVGEQIKGRLDPEITVVVYQAGPEFQVGKEYMFATNDHPTQSWQVAFSGVEYPSIGKNRSDLIDDFRQAYKSEIPYNPTVEGR